MRSTFNNRSPQSLAELYRYIRLPLRGERYELGRRGIYGQVFSGAEGVVTEVLVPLQNGHAVSYPWTPHRSQMRVKLYDDGSCRWGKSSKQMIVLSNAPISSCPPVSACYIMERCESWTTVEHSCLWLSPLTTSANRRKSAVERERRTW